MGRHRNALIRDNFTRGPKLKDSSNRYPHTCKNCGEHFPKGRIDSLQNHLLKQCRALTAEDRKQILSRVGQIPGQIQEDLDSSSPTYSSQKDRDDISFEFAPPFDGLNVLAEASRQVGANQQFRQNIHTVQTGNAFPVDPTLHAPPLDDVFDTPLSFEQLQSRPQMHQSSSLSPHLPHTTLVTADAAQLPAHSSTDLPSVAVSAQDMVSNETLHIAQDMSRVFENAEVDYLENTPEKAVLTRRDADPASRAAIHPRRIVARPSGRELDDLVNRTHMSSKKRGRAPFSADRRQEVSNLRKKGACLRCRVLRKPCSFEDPCKSCSAVGTSRTWTWPCSRNRIAHEVQVYSSGLYCNVAYKELSLIKDRLQFKNAKYHIEVFHSEIGTHRETFESVKVSTWPYSEQQPSPSSKDNKRSLIYIDNESVDVNDKMRKYVKQSVIDVYEEEPHSPVKITVEMALCNISADQKDTFLPSVVELWTATTLLVRKKEDWKVKVNGILIPAETSLSNLGQIEASSHRLIISQLLSAIEQTAEKLCQDVVSQLEQRFMRKLHDGIFDTFLASIIVLSCMERMYWLYLTWDAPEVSKQCSRWPLDHPPVHYIQGVENFCEILLMLLRVRELVPSIGFNHYRDEYVHTVSPINDGIKRWIDNIQVTQEYLEGRRYAQFDTDDFRSLDMKLISKLLQIIVLPPPNDVGEQRS